MADSPQPKRLKRVVVYIPELLHRQLKAKLAGEGTNVSDWFRKKSEEEVDDKSTP